MFRHETALNEFTLHIIARSGAEARHRSGVIRVAERKNDKEPPPTKMKFGEKMSGEDGLTASELGILKLTKRDKAMKLHSHK